MTSGGSVVGLYCYPFPLVMEKLMAFAFQIWTVALAMEIQVKEIHAGDYRQE